jgi:2-phosphoglycerate kinase
MAYIVGIGGVRAAGKSTLARNLGQILRADIISSGRTREMLRAQYERGKLPELFESVTNAPSVAESVRYLTVQSETMRPSLLAAIRQCRGREANLIIEGTHVYPGLFGKELDLEVLLVAPGEKLSYRIHKDKKRRISKKAILRSAELQDYLKREALKHRVAVIDTTSLPRALIEIVKLLPPEKLPLTYFE